MAYPTTRHSHSPARHGACAWHDASASGTIVSAAATWGRSWSVVVEAARADPAGGLSHVWVPARSSEAHDERWMRRSVAQDRAYGDAVGTARHWGGLRAGQG